VEVAQLCTRAGIDAERALKLPAVGEYTPHPAIDSPRWYEGY
jgi:hypothetical protein